MLAQITLPLIGELSVTRQLLFNGIVLGLITGLLGFGIVLIHRSTKVINFAVGNMGIPASALFALVTVNYGFPLVPALIVSLIVGTAIAGVLELTIIRRLFDAPRVVVLVATIAMAQLLAFIALRYPKLDPAPGARYPLIIDTTVEDFAGVRITGAQLSVVIAVPVIALALSWFLNRTTFGQSVAASADNPDLARLSGISPRTVSTVVWTIAGFLASVSLILQSAQGGALAGITNLGPSAMVRALAAAVIGGMRSFPRAMAAGVAIGVVESVVRFNYFQTRGLIDFLLFAAIVVAVFFQGRRENDDTQTFSFVPKSPQLPAHIRRLPVATRSGPVLIALALAAAIVLPLIVDLPSRHLLYGQIVAYAVCGLSVVVVTGWAGQIALGQMAFAGIGALSAAAFVRAGVPFVLAILLGACIVALIAGLIGVGALRIRGLLLAISTFAFGIAAESFLYRRELLSDGNSTSVPFVRGSVLGIDLDTQRSYYWFSLAILVAASAAVVRIRNSGAGRTTIAVRDNQNSASAYTISPTFVKLRAFTVSGFLAGLGGGLIAGSVQTVDIAERFFFTADSLQLIAMVVIGGIGSVLGAILGALWVLGLPAFAPDNNVVPFLSSTLGLLLVLMYFPGGLSHRLVELRSAALRWFGERAGAEQSAKSDMSVVDLTDEATRQRREAEKAVADDRAASASDETAVGTTAALATEDVSVRFGGLHAVDGVSINVMQGEIVGLIGTNGAGKSTLMNAVGGYVESTGRVRLGGTDISSMAPARRAERGLGRTFQAATLFPELTVRETVMVALEARGHTGLLSTLTFAPPAIALERRQRSAADDLIDFLGLGRYADAYISDLSTGTRRIVELAGLLALDARVLCLDEPTAGVAQRETEAFGPLLVRIGQELSASILVIEHDMPLIMSISDRVYCLEAGVVIAEGEPDAVRNDPRVVSSYLGTDSRAIERSDAGTVPG